MKKNHSEIFSSLFIGASMLMQLSSCGKIKSSLMPDLHAEHDQLRMAPSSPGLNQKELEEEVTYLAVLNPVNAQVAGQVYGAVTFNRTGDFMVGDVRVSGAAPDIIHAQNIHIGSMCPTEAADVNEDGIIDVFEMHRYTESILIPLDGDLNSQFAGSGLYPVADPWGSYVYSKVASFPEFLLDLQSPDENVFDNVIKLSKQRSFNLLDKVVIIHGVAPETPLPYTVASFSGLTSQATLPIACGVFTKVEATPGVIEEDDITLGRVARSVEDAPDEEAEEDRPDETNDDQGNGERRSDSENSPETPPASELPIKE
jgi:hypothetical protein